MTTGDALFTNWKAPDGEPLPTDTLKMRLDIYLESIVLRGYDERVTWTSVVSANDIAEVFTRHLPVGSGLLPTETLWWAHSADGPLVGLWRPARVWPVGMREDPFQLPRRMRLPMPGLVFVCSPGRPPWVFAAAERPASAEDVLYKVPAFNVFSSGAVCPGTHTFPEAVDQIPESFFGAYFSRTGDTRNRSRRQPDNLMALWEELDGTEDYPCEDLVEQATVEDVMALPGSVRRW